MSKGVFARYRVFQSYPDSFSQPIKKDGKYLPLYTTKAAAQKEIEANLDKFVGKEIEIRQVFLVLDTPEPVETETQEDLSTRPQNKPAAQADG